MPQGTPLAQGLFAAYVWWRESSTKSSAHLRTSGFAVSVILGSYLGSLTVLWGPTSSISWRTSSPMRCACSMGTWKERPVHRGRLDPGDFIGISCLRLLFDTQLVPYERIYGFILDFEGLPDGLHASFTREIGVVFGTYDCNVIELNSVSVRATAETVMWNVPKFVPEESWSLTPLFSGGFAGWSQATDFLNHDIEQIAITSLVAVEFDTRTELFLWTWDLCGLTWSLYSFPSWWALWNLWHSA